MGRIDEKLEKYLDIVNEEKEYIAYEVEGKEKKGLVAKIARGVSKVMGVREHM